MDDYLPKFQIIKGPKFQIPDDPNVSFDEILDVCVEEEESTSDTDNTDHNLKPRKSDIQEGRGDIENVICPFPSTSNNNKSVLG